jgi:hypothetical protein
MFASALLNANRKLIIEQSAARLPAIYQFLSIARMVDLPVTNAPLRCFGTRPECSQGDGGNDTRRHAGRAADHDGAVPNLQTAKALGLTVPPSIRPR